MHAAKWMYLLAVICTYLISGTYAVSEKRDGVANPNAAALETIGLTICVTAVCVYITDSTFCENGLVF